MKRMTQINMSYFVCFFGRCGALQKHWSTSGTRSVIRTLPYLLLDLTKCSFLYQYVWPCEKDLSTFVNNSQIAPFTSVIINGIYWAVGSPRLLTLPDAKQLLRPVHMPWLPISDGAPRLPHRLLAICDISADPGGSIEFMKECTTIDNPFSVYDAELHIEHYR